MQLLCSQQELRAADEKLRQRSEECRLAQERVCELERASQKVQGDQGRTKELLKEKATLEAEVDRLKQEALQVGAMLHIVFSSTFLCRPFKA